jgi:hypothetical protein
MAGYDPLKYPDCIEKARIDTMDGSTAEVTMLISNGSVYVTNIIFTAPMRLIFDDMPWLKDWKVDEELPAEPDFTIDDPFDEYED